jgi:hypothetical protein
VSFPRCFEVYTAQQYGNPGEVGEKWGIRSMFSESTGFYLYSSLLQANAAILSILGVFTIFRIQSIQSVIDIIKSSLILTVRPGQYPETSAMDRFDNMSLDEKKEEINQSYGGNQNNRYENWCKKELQIQKIGNSKKLPSYLLAISMIILSVLLIFSKWIHTVGILFKILCYLMVIVFESIILINILKYIFQTIGIKKYN